MTASGRIRLAEAAKRIGVSHMTLRRWCHAGAIGHYVVGPSNYIEFDPAEVDAFIRAMRRDPRQPPVV